MGCGASLESDVAHGAEKPRPDPSKPPPGDVPGVVVSSAADASNNADPEQPKEGGTAAADAGADDGRNLHSEGAAAAAAAADEVEKDLTVMSVGASSPSSRTLTPATVVTRKEVSALSPAEEARFVAAIRTMMRNAGDEPETSEFFRLAGYHGWPDDYCAHGQEVAHPPTPLGPEPSAPVKTECKVFPAWHRAYLVEFETALRKADRSNGGDGAIALPYWDWVASPELPRVLQEQLAELPRGMFKEDPDANSARSQLAGLGLVEPDSADEFRAVQERLSAERGEPNRFMQPLEPFKHPTSGLPFMPGDCFTTEPLGYRYDVLPHRPPPRMSVAPSLCLFMGIDALALQRKSYMVYVFVLPSVAAAEEWAPPGDDPEAWLAAPTFAGAAAVFGGKGSECGNCQTRPPYNVFVDVTEALAKAGVTRFEAEVRVAVVDELGAVVPPEATPLPKPLLVGPFFEVEGMALALGGKGSEVRHLQEYLQSTGYYNGPCTGEFDASTDAALKAFQDFIHFDAAERWRLQGSPSVPNSFELQVVALHEVGHVLGIQHSPHEAAVMYPFYAPGKTQLTAADTELASGLHL